MEEVNVQCTSCAWIGNFDDVDTSGSDYPCPVCGAEIEEFVPDENDQDGFPDY